MKRLLVLRHAKSSWKHRGLTDHDRPLNKRGKRDAPGMGRWILEQRLTPELILSSTAVRARETALAVSEASESGGEVRLLRELYLAGPESYRAALAALPEELSSVMVVGHNPGLEELVEGLTGARETMPTAALALIELPIELWGLVELDGGGNLAHLWRPKELFA